MNERSPEEKHDHIGSALFVPSELFCKKCGSNLNQDTLYCPKCGAKQKIGRSPRKRTISIALAAVLIVSVFTIALLIRGTPVSGVSLNKSEAVLEIGDHFSLLLTVTPGNAKSKTVSWATSDSTIAVVDSEGVVTAMDAGTCIITVCSNNGKTDNCIITVNQRMPDFMELFSTYANKSWCKIGEDGSWMALDSNPENYDNDSFEYLIWFGLNFSDYEEAEKEICKTLGFGDSLILLMNSTTALQGRQAEENDHYKVSWAYHPDNGLEAMFEIKR